MTFAPNTYTSNDLDIANFNPFIFANETRGREIHLPNYEPTNLADNSYFGTLRDDSNPSTGRYYKTVDNLPWAINVQTGFNHMQEKVEITQGYNFFFNWAASGGSTFNNWNLPLPGNVNNASIY
jgi:LruC domain-containing protein